MAEPREYPPGTPSWVDLGTPDLDAARRFYGGLLGWDVVDQGPDAGGYAMAMLRGQPVAGLGPQMNPGPPYWTTYVNVADADTAVAKVKDAGGTVFMDPMDVLDVGRMAIFADTEGAVCAVWQPRRHRGAQIVNEPGSFCWNELGSRNLDAARRFYGSVFGWEAHTNEGPPMSYTEWKLDGRSIAGAMEMGPQIPAQVPPNWLVYFAVDDCDASVTQAKALGGTVMVEPTDTPAGRFSVLADPQGAVFAVIKLTSPGAA